MSLSFIKEYEYPTLVRNTPANGQRYYICPATGRHLPSVTRVLDHTADKTGLLEWRKRVGDKEADRIKYEATGLGTLVHEHLEKFIMGKPRPTGNNLVRQQAEAMADQIIEHGLTQVSEIYGSEVGLFMPGLYAGTADSIASVHGLPRCDGEWVDPGVLSVIDFKSAKKIKKREHIEDYLTQIVAYGMAHDGLFDTQIEQGVIYMVDRDFQFEKFVLNGAEFKSYQGKWLDRLDQYYSKAGITAA